MCPESKVRELRSQVDSHDLQGKILTNFGGKLPREWRRLPPPYSRIPLRIIQPVLQGLLCHKTCLVSMGYSSSDAEVLVQS
jgi:hypothetical protein